MYNEQGHYTKIRFLGGGVVAVYEALYSISLYNCFKIILTQDIGTGDVNILTTITRLMTDKITVTAPNKAGGGAASCKSSCYTRANLRRWCSCGGS
jgi:hypothetical protein